MPQNYFERIKDILCRRNLLIIFAVTLIVRVICMVVLQSWELPDEWSFGNELGGIGRNIAQGKGFALYFGPTSKFPPVYPYLIGGVFAAFGIYSKVSAVILFIFQSINAAVIAVCLVVIGNHFLSQKEASH
jgi:hypothetical protein